MSKGILIFIQESEEDGAGCIASVILFLVILFFLLIGLLHFAEWLTKWQDYDFPARQIAAIYYYGLALPLKGLLYPWHFIRTESLTPYPNLNLVLAIVAIVLVLILVAVLFRLVFRVLGKVAWISLVTFLIGPWLFWGIWLVYQWLAAPHVPS